MKLKYQKPKIKSSKIKINFFLMNNRFFDSIDSLAGPNQLAAVIGGDCGCGSDCGGCGGGPPGFEP